MKTKLNKNAFLVIICGIFKIKLNKTETTNIKGKIFKENVL